MVGMGSPVGGGGRRSGGRINRLVCLGHFAQILAGRFRGSATKEAVPLGNLLVGSPKVGVVSRQVCHNIRRNRLSPKLAIRFEASFVFAEEAAGRSLTIVHWVRWRAHRSSQILRVSSDIQGLRAGSSRRGGSGVWSTTCWKRKSIFGIGPQGHREWWGLAALEVVVVAFGRLKEVFGDNHPVIQRHSTGACESAPS